jgi:hypothetical protein
VEVAEPAGGLLAGGGLGLGAAPATPGAGRWLVTSVRHRFVGAFTTELDLVGEGGTGPGSTPIPGS